MNPIAVKIKKVNPNATIPTQGSGKAAGFDLYACIENPVEIRSGESVRISTGVAIEPPSGYFGAILARSGLSTKQGLRPSNCVGCCDNDYTGEYIVALYNDSDRTRTVNPNDRIAQLVFLPYLNVRFVEVDELSETDRGDSGFGSSGK